MVNTVTHERGFLDRFLHFLRWQYFRYLRNLRYVVVSVA